MIYMVYQMTMNAVEEKKGEYEGSGDLVYTGWSRKASLPIIIQFIN